MGLVDMHVGGGPCLGMLGKHWGQHFARYVHVCFERATAERVMMDGV